LVPFASLTNRMTRITSAGRVFPIGSVEGYGAKGDGVTSDTAAFHAAFAAVSNGGQINVPAGNYRVNLKIFTSKSVNIQGEGSGLGATSKTTLIPSDLNDYVLEIGDDSSYVRGVTFRDIAFEAERPDGARGKLGIKLGAGALESVFFNCTVARFTTHGLEVEGGTTFAATVNRFFGCNFITYSGLGNNSFILMRQTANWPISFTTGLEFHGCYFNQPSSTGYLLELDSAEARFIGGWMDLGATGHGIKFTKSFSQEPMLRGNGVTLDCGGGVNVLATTYNTSKRIADFFEGAIDMSGVIKDSTNGTQAVYGKHQGAYQDFHSYPYVTGTLNLQDPYASNAWDWNIDHEWHADHGDMVGRSKGNILLQPGALANTNDLARVEGGGGFQSDMGGRFGGAGGPMARLATLETIPSNPDEPALWVQGYTSGGVTASQNLAMFRDPNSTINSTIDSDAAFSPHQLHLGGTFNGTHACW